MITFSLSAAHFTAITENFHTVVITASRNHLGFAKLKQLGLYHIKKFTVLVSKLFVLSHTTKAIIALDRYRNTAMNVNPETENSC